MTQLKYQNYLHYKLPITIKPLEYGKLIKQICNEYIIQLNTNNIVIIKENDNENIVEFFRKGELMIEYKDSKVSNRMFTRFISNQKFTFRDNNLVSTEVLVNKYLNILTFLFILLLSIKFHENYTFTQLAVVPFGNIIKLRKTKSRNIWETSIININSKVFSKTLFENTFNKFWNQISPKFKENNYMFILFKVKYINNEFATIGKLQKLTNKDKDWYINWIINNMIYKSEYYNETPLESILLVTDLKMKY